MERKDITIIDFYRSSEEQELVFLETVRKIKSLGDKVLLVTGGEISREVQKSVDYILYNGDNLLFQKFDYEYFHPWNFRTFNGSFFHHSFNFSVQRHGLAVLVNLFNSLNFAKSLGYTHFRRILYDFTPGEGSLNWMKSVSIICEEEGKSGFFYFNEPNTIEGKNYPDLRGEFFYCEIDFFLSKVPQVNSEESYRESLLKNFGSLKFLICEKYIYEFIKNSNEIEIRNSSDFEVDFSDSIKEIQQNSISELNFHPKYKSIICRITRSSSNDDLFVYAQSYSKEEQNREVVVKYEDGQDQRIFFSLPPNNWYFHKIGDKVSEIEIYEEEILLYTEKNGESRNYIEFL